MYIFFIFLMLMTSIAQADVYVLTDQNNAVLGLSEQNDMVIPSGNKINIIKGQSISNLPISGNVKLYTFSNGSFSLNATAVQAQQDEQKADIAAQTARDNARAIAISKLKALGLGDDEIKALLR